METTAGVLLRAGEPSTAAGARPLMPNRLHGGMARSIRNDMRSPLLGVQALRDSLASTPLAPELTERMEQQLRVLTRRVELLMEDLALVSSYDVRTVALEPAVLDLDTELGALVAGVPDLVVRIKGRTGLAVRADRLRFEQLWANLVRNAQRSRGWQVTVRVSTQGKEVSFRVDNPGPREAYELAIVRFLVQCHGGAAIHEPGGTFAFTLPRHK